MATMRVNVCIRSSWSFILLPLSELLGGISLFELRSMDESGTEGANLCNRCLSGTIDLTYHHQHRILKAQLTCTLRHCCHRCHHFGSSLSSLHYSQRSQPESFDTASCSSPHGSRGQSDKDKSHPRESS